MILCPVLCPFFCCRVSLLHTHTVKVWRLYQQYDHSDICGMMFIPNVSLWAYCWHTFIFTVHHQAWNNSYYKTADIASGPKLYFLPHAAQCLLMKVVPSKPGENMCLWSDITYPKVGINAYGLMISIKRLMVFPQSLTLAALLVPILANTCTWYLIALYLRHEGDPTLDPKITCGMTN